MYNRKCAYLLQTPTVQLSHFCFSHSPYNEKTVIGYTLLTDYHPMHCLRIRILMYQCRHLK